MDVPIEDDLRVLVVEDDEDYADVVMRMLERNPELAMKLHRTVTMSGAEEWLATRTGEVDVVLLDLHLPDEHGLRTIQRMRDSAPASAIVVMTAMREQQLAYEAIKLGAQEYVVKDDLTPQLLLRTVRYAHERRRLLDQLKDAERASERERELRKLERIADQHTTSSVTAGMYGDNSLRVNLADRYEEAVEEYLRLLDEALEERAYKTRPSVNEDLRSLASVLGVLRASPRDVIELHTEAMRRVVGRAVVERSQWYVEEGRILVLELMGYLAAYYRARAVDARRDAVPSTAEKGHR